MVQSVIPSLAWRLRLIGRKRERLDPAGQTRWSAFNVSCIRRNRVGGWSGSRHVNRWIVTALKQWSPCAGSRRRLLRVTVWTCRILLSIRVWRVPNSLCTQMGRGRAWGLYLGCFPHRSTAKHSARSWTQPTGHVARPSRSIETRSFPCLARRHLATLPSMSLTPVAPFAAWLVETL